MIEAMTRYWWRVFYWLLASEMDPYRRTIKGVPLDKIMRGRWGIGGRS